MHKALAKNTYILNNERELLAFKDNWGFYRVVITQNIINAIKSVNNISIATNKVIGKQNFLNANNIKIYNICAKPIHLK